MNMKQSSPHSFTLSAEKVMTLLTMGIDDSCFMVYQKVIHPDGAIQWIIREPDPTNNTDPVIIPAWTYEEIRVMIGSSMAPGYVDIPFNFHPEKKGVELRFCVNNLSGQKPFKSGVEALGEVLIKMIDDGVVEVEDCNARYEKIYKPK